MAAPRQYGFTIVNSIVAVPTRLSVGAELGIYACIIHKKDGFVNCTLVHGGMHLSAKGQCTVLTVRSGEPEQVEVYEAGDTVGKMKLESISK